MLAAEALKNAAPDGKTLMISPITVTVFAPLTHTKLRYDPIKDFAPVSLAATFQLALAVGPGSPRRRCTNTSLGCVRIRRRRRTAHRRPAARRISLA